MQTLTLRGWTVGDPLLDVGIETLCYDPTTGVLLVGTGGTGGLRSYDVAEGQALSIVDQEYYAPSEAYLITGEIDVTTLNGDTVVFVGGAGPNGYLTYTMNASGQIGAAQSVGAQPNGPPDLAARYISDAGIHYLAGENATGFGVYKVKNTGTLSRSSQVTDTETTHARDLADITGIRIGDRDIVISASRSEKGVTSYIADPTTGALTAVDSLGAAEGLGILDTITQVETVQTGGKSYVIVASASNNGQMGAISVLRVKYSGDLVATDHVLDTLDTRFAGVQAMTTVTVDDRVYVVAGGADDGLSLFVLLPNGQLQHLSSISDEANTGLTNVTAVEAVHTGDEVQVFVASQSEAGITHFTFSVANQGDILFAAAQGGTVTGTAGDDILVGDAGNDLLTGGTGDDILQDGDGRDTLDGGAGADLFVMAADGSQDEIIGFDPTEDLIDLSTWPFLYGSDPLTITQQGSGVRITWRTEELTVAPEAGAVLDPEDVRDSIVFGADRPPLVVPNEVVGTEGPDNLEGTVDADDIQTLGGNDTVYSYNGDDTLRGGDGNDSLHSGKGDDTVEGGNGDDWIRLGQGNDVSRDGTAGNDTILADAGHDTVLAGAGNDSVQGHAGYDSIEGGAGNDILFGGYGFDTIRGDDGDDTVNPGDGRDLVYLGNGNDVFFDNEQSGSIGSDTVFGGAGQDRLEGGGGADSLDGGGEQDVISGRDGNDTLAGGNNDDTIYAGDGNDIVRGDKGQDRVFLGNGNDRFNDLNQTGDFGRDSVRGGTGNDTLESGGGDDTLMGGNGFDTFIVADNAGDRIISDFAVGVDEVQLEASQVFLSDTPNGLVLDWQDGSVVLTGVTSAELQNGDLIFI